MRHETKGSTFVADGEEVERCRRVRRKLESQFRTRAEFFTLLERLQQQHDRKQAGITRRGNGSTSRKKARSKSTS